MDKRAWIVLAAILGSLALSEVVPWWVLIVCFVVWAVHIGYLSRKRSADEQAEEQSHIAREAPELVGMDFVTRTSYLLNAADEFAAVASDVERQEYIDSLEQTKTLFASRGKAMPSWFHLVILRAIERRRVAASAATDLPINNS